MRTPRLFPRDLLAPALVGALVFSLPAVCLADGVNVPVRAAERVQGEMPDILPDMPDMPEFDGDEPPAFEESPLDPGEVPPPDLPEQAEEPGNGKDDAKTAEPRPQEPDLDTLFSMLKNEDSQQARAHAAHRIQMRWVRSGSATVDLLMARASAALEAKKPELALDLLDAVVRFRPDYAAGWNRRAAAHFMAGHLGPAIADIERTLAIEPRHWGALTGLAAIQQATDEDAAALATYERILEIYPHQEKAEKAAEELRKSTAGVEL